MAGHVVYTVFLASFNFPPLYIPSLSWSLEALAHFTLQTLAAFLPATTCISLHPFWASLRNESENLSTSWSVET